jgi:DNA (cytosine-5)-methyltransferase 1
VTKPSGRMTRPRIRRSVRTPAAALPLEKAFPSMFGAAECRPESFEVDRRAGVVERRVRRRDGRDSVTRLAVTQIEKGADAGAIYDQAWLRSTAVPEAGGSGARLRMADLFCGAGGFALGVDEAARALGLHVDHCLAADIEPSALMTFQDNFRPHHSLDQPIENHIDGDIGGRLTAAERALRKRVGEIHLVTGGPPCQGHSDLNNHTRRADPKNALYLRMARFAEVFEPETVIIENVPGVRMDRSGVFRKTLDALRQMGYSVCDHVMEMERFGVPQRRRRVIVIATTAKVGARAIFEGVESGYEVEPRSVKWAIGDLVDRENETALDGVTKLSPVSTRRVNWLYDNDEYDLPNRMRPACHRFKKHSYNAVYGRLYWDQPAWTITTGFQVMGQGRFLHPVRRRVITSHEAARLQFFPDYFGFRASNRKYYAKMIGNAVPAKLAYLLALELLR